ncbi:MAG: TonB-dependent receptor [Candidatus Goldbacteria bacterium]|nr:TonB-dependent receptor [Candidatus Goldiibacteriota bacterium]
MNLKRFILVAVCVLFLFHGVFAEEAQQSAGKKETVEVQADSRGNTGVIMTVIVTARKTESSLEDTARSVKVITKEEIEKTGCLSLAEIIKNTAGAVVSSNGYISGVSAVSLRGKSSTQTLVLLNGVPLKDIMTGGYDISGIDLSSIKRIEVIKGGISSVYGPDAMGGVINLLTGDDENSLIKASSRYGSFGYQKNQISSSHIIGDFDYFASGTEEKGDGYREHSAFTKRMLNTNINYSVNVFKFGFFGNYLNYGQEVPGSLSWLSPLAKQWSEDYILGLSGSAAVSEFLVKADGFYKSSDLKYQNPDPFYPINSRHIAKEWQGSFTAAYDNNDNISGLAGAEFNNKNMDSTDVGKKTIQNTAFFTNAVYLPVSVIILNGGVRHDMSTAYNDMTSASAGIKYLMDSKVEIHAAVDNSFSAPTIGQLYWPFDGMMVGNVNLKAEKSTGYEVGIKQQAENFKHSYVWFSKDVRDMIQYVSDSVTWTGTYENLSGVKITGLEAEAEYNPFDFLKITAAYTYTNAVDSASGQKISLIPEGRISGDITIQPDKNMSVVLKGEYTDACKDNSGAIIREYYLVGLNVSGRLNKNVRIFAAAHNLLDNKEYVIAKGYPMPGRSVSAGAEIKF